MVRTLGVGGSEATLGRSAPGGPADDRGGARLLLKKVGGKETPGSALDPGFYGPLTLVRSFWGSLSLMRSRGYFVRYAKTDLGRIFPEKICWKAFLRKKVFNPLRSHPQSLPLGGKVGRRMPGSDEGAIWYPTFPCRKEDDGCRPDGLLLLPRWASRSPPHQSPSVTASPQGEASGLCSPTRRSVPNQGTQMGTEIGARPEQCATTAKTSERAASGP